MMWIKCLDTSSCRLKWIVKSCKSCALSIPTVCWFAVLGVLLASVLPGAAKSKGVSGKAGPEIDFNRQIRPIFSENCFACHGPDKNKRKAGFRLDQKESAPNKLESGNIAIVPGNPAASKLLKVVASDDDDERMPPRKAGKSLTKEQIGLLRQWIEQGAPWQPHWSYL